MIASESRKLAVSMGTFYTKCKIENPSDRTRSVVIPKLLVDTGSDYTWVPERVLERIGVQREKKDSSRSFAGSCTLASSPHPMCNRPRG